MENNENMEFVESAPEVVEAPAPEVVEAAATASSKGMSIAALVCGILGLVGDFIPYLSYFMFVLSILAIVFGAKAKKTATVSKEPTGMATAGLVLGIIGVSLGVLGILCSVCALCGLGALIGAAG